MPIRKTPLVNGQIYHVFNKSTGSIPIFTNSREFKRFIFGMSFYQNRNIPLRLSKFNRLSKEQRNKILSEMKSKQDFLVELISYCIMPNHFHYILKQLTNDGIKEFIRLTSNSYSHFYNIRHDRSGSVFGGRFKAVLIENDEQLLHVVRYIHLNPFSTYIIKDRNELERYQYSSFLEYIGRSTSNLCQKDIILNNFKARDKYKEFVLNHADYQRTIERIKHLSID